MLCYLYTRSVDTLTCSNKNGIRYIDFKCYSIRIRNVESGLYCVNAGHKSDIYFNEIAQYVRATDFDEAGNIALGLLKDYLIGMLGEIEGTIKEINEAIPTEDSET